MTTLTLSLLKIPIGILTSRQLNIAKTRRSLWVLLTATVFVVIAYKPPSGGRTPPRRGTTTFTGTSEILAKQLQVPSFTQQFNSTFVKG